jgi:hypothetical protein
MTMTITPQGRQRYYDNDGNLAVGCLLYTYAATTTTPKATYQDAAGTTPHTNPIVLDAKGEAVIYWSGAYKVDLKTATGVQITGWPVDNIVSPLSTSDFLGTAGAGMIGFLASIIYPVGSIGRWLVDLATAAGAAMIGFSHAGTYPAGSLGAKEKYTVSVKDAPFDAVGNGIANDTAALLAAKTYSDRPHVPAGTYLADSPDGLHGLWGEGSLLIDGVTLELPKHPDRADNFVTDTFCRYARVNANWSPVFLPGDSITEGTRASDWKVDNYASILRKAFQERYQNTNFGFANFDTFIYDTYPSATQYPHNVTHSGFNVLNSFQDSYFGGVAIRSTTLGEYVEMAYYGKDAHLVYEQDAANGAILEVTLDGVVVGTIDTKVTSTAFLSLSALKASISGPIAVSGNGNHIIRLTNTENKPATLCGMIYVDDYLEVSPVVFNCGRSSIALSDIPDNIIDIYARESGKSILPLGVNDDLLSKPIATFKAKVQRYLEGVVSVDGTCVVCDFIFSKPTSNLYKTVLREYAYVYGMPYIDFGRLWLADTTANQYLDYLDADGVHPTDAGHEFIANEILRVIGLPHDKGSCKGIGRPLTPTFQNAWVNFGSTYEPVSFYKDKEGIVHLQGLMKNGSTVAYSAIFVLPLGWRPAATQIFTVNANHAFGEIEIRADGQVQVGNAITNTLVSFSGVSFKAA